jgi:hypothetical protein
MMMMEACHKENKCMSVSPIIGIDVMMSHGLMATHFLARTALQAQTSRYYYFWRWVFLMRGHWQSTTTKITIEVISAFDYNL